MSCESSADPKRATSGVSSVRFACKSRQFELAISPLLVHAPRLLRGLALVRPGADHGPVRALVPDRGDGRRRLGRNRFRNRFRSRFRRRRRRRRIEKRFGAACRPVRSARARRVLLGEGGRGRHACGRGDRGEREERVATRASARVGRSRDFARAVVLGGNTRARDDAQPSVSVVFDARRSREGVRFGPGAPRADHAGRGCHRARGRARRRHRLRRYEVFAKAAALFRRTEARAPVCDRSCRWRGYRHVTAKRRSQSTLTRRRRKCACLGRRVSGDGHSRLREPSLRARPWTRPPKRSSTPPWVTSPRPAGACTDAKVTRSATTIRDAWRARSERPMPSGISTHFFANARSSHAVTCTTRHTLTSHRVESPPAYLFSRRPRLRTVKHASQGVLQETRRQESPRRPRRAGSPEAGKETPRRLGGHGSEAGEGEEEEEEERRRCGRECRFGSGFAR